jgi:hypothetical protein
MKKNIPTLITLIAVIIAISGVSAAVKASKQKALAEIEADTLRKQIVELKQNRNSKKSPARNESKPIEQEGSEPKEELVVLQESSDETPAEQERPERQERESFEDRMAKMKEEDPEGYAEMIQQRQERQESMRYNLAERTATFMDLDTSNMTEEERVNHEQLVERMANVWALTEQFQDPEEQPDREVMRELFNEMREVRPLMDLERSVMFKQLGSDLGYEGDEAETFAAHVEEIIESTSIQTPRGGGGRGGRGGGGRGGQGGGDGAAQ